MTKKSTSELTRSEFDCVVLGAGPAGSTTAAIVAGSGASTLLLERESMPRFHVGESMMPEIYWTLERLGLLDRMKQAGAYTRKNGVQFVNHQGKESRPFFFAEHDDSEASQTWHVKRGDFDQMLFECAAENGAVCRDESRVLGVVFGENDQRHKVVFQDSAGQKHEVTARVVVDGSGQQSIIANRLGLKNVNPKLKKAAIWGYYQNAKRNSTDGTNQPEVTSILHSSNKKSWFWYIPLSDGTVSVGCVGDNEYVVKSGTSPSEVFERELNFCKPMQNRLEGASLVGKLKVAKEFSYTTTQHAGDGWVLVGDAYGFIDPVYSSGVYLAFKSGELAADAIVEGLGKNDLSAAQLGSWDQDFDDGVKWIRKLVHAFYIDDFSFGDFMKDYPQHAGNLTDLLIGRVFSGNPGAIFADMEPWIEKHCHGGTIETPNAVTA